MFGKIAKTKGYYLPIGVYKCGLGWFIGTVQDGTPISYESKGYWRTKSAALNALRTGAWVQRESE